MDDISTEEAKAEESYYDTTTASSELQGEQIEPGEIAEGTGTMDTKDALHAIIPAEIEDVRKESGNFIQEMETMKLQGRALALVEHNEYTDARKYLRKIESVKPSKFAEIYNMILVTECNMMCGDYYLSGSNIEYLVQVMHDHRLLSSEIEKLGSNFGREKLYVRAFILFFSAAKLCQMNERSSEVAVFITKQVREITNLVESGINNQCGYIQRITIDIVIPNVKTLCEDLTKLSNENQDSAVLYRSECLFYVALCYTHCLAYDESVRELESVIDLMEREFKEECAKYRLYGGCFQLLGTLHAEIDNKDIATEKYNAAINAFQTANDWGNENEKNKSIENVKGSLVEMRTEQKKKKLSVSQKLEKWARKNMF